VAERRELRRRLRERRRVREALLLDLGALVYELHRQGKRAPELLQHKAAELSDVDDEVRELEDALDGVAAEEGEPVPTETGELDALEQAADDELEDEPEPPEPVLAEREERRL
jgi:hypothetical protein